MKTLLLLGGGHSHIEVIRRFGMQPPRDTRTVLISPERHATYSGMLPGLVAGHYSFDQCHIELPALCRAAGVEFHMTQACALEPDARRVRCANGTMLGYDFLSIDIGSLPDTTSITTGLERAVGIKPAGAFLAAWRHVVDRAAASGRAPRVIVIGGGAGGVEIALAMHHRLRLGTRSAAMSLVDVVSDGPSLLSGFPPRARSMVEQLCGERGINIHVHSRVTRIEGAQVHRASGPPIPADHVFLATGACPPAWVAASGLRADERGYILVNDALQSLSHPDVYAAGDIASMANHSRPKSGVYAVRQGPPLATNLVRALAGQGPLGYAPQRHALALISTGGRHAIACFGSLAVAGAWVWQWKDWIDRRFVATYRIGT